MLRLISICTVLFLFPQISWAGLISPNTESQLQDWLGEGNVSFNLLYEKLEGDTSTTFHSKVDGKGRTISLVHVNKLFKDGAWIDVDFILGGYNPQSWNSSGSYNITTTPDEQTAFLFLISANSNQQAKQNLGFSEGYYQTYNEGSFGPTFGFGHDLYIAENLIDGSSYQNGYGGSANQVSNLFGDGPPSQYTYFQIDQLEVYTIQASPVPAPAGLLLGLIGTSFLGLFGRVRGSWRAKKTTVA